MSPDILIIREGNGYRVLHGHLHLASQLSLHKEIEVDVKNEGRIKIMRTSSGVMAGREGRQLPILAS
ncbi:MAG TPA: hypothetical protein VF450_16220 [Noviherbaspirillum sp.]